MKRSWIIPLTFVAVVALVWAAGGGEARASNKIAKEQGLQCTVCHDKPGSKLLTDRGKFFEEMRTLDGYDDVVVAFSKCTTCHVRKPGSKALTERGERYAWVAGDMEGLRQWLRENHPVLKRMPAEEKPPR